MIKCPHCKSQMKQVNSQVVPVVGTPKGVGIALSCHVCDTLLDFIYNGSAPTGATAKGAKDIINSNLDD